MLGSLYYGGNRSLVKKRISGISKKGNCDLQKWQRDDLFLTTRLRSIDYKYWPHQSVQSSVSPVVVSECFAISFPYKRKWPSSFSSSFISW